MEEMTIRDITRAYIQALGLQKRPPDLAYLGEITRCHVAQFSFSSVGPMLGDDLPLNIQALYQRIVVNRRGGYCFEQNGLMYAVLRELGFKVKLYLCRVIYNRDIHPGLTHRITLVEIDGNRYIADVGFGPLGPQLPVSMSGEESQENFRLFRIREQNPREFHMQTLKDGEFYTLYKFEPARYGQADCEVGHFYSHKHPGATFVNHLVVSKILDHEVLSLRNHEFQAITKSGVHSHCIANEPELQIVLDTRFGVRVNDAESHRLFARSCAETLDLSE